jgi:hypothetical protein
MGALSPIAENACRLSLPPISGNRDQNALAVVTMQTVAFDQAIKQCPRCSKPVATIALCVSNEGSLPFNPPITFANVPFDLGKQLSPHRICPLLQSEDDVSVIAF